MFAILVWSMTKRQFLPLVLVLSSPRDMRQTSFLDPVCRVFRISGLESGGDGVPCVCVDHFRAEVTSVDIVEAFLRCPLFWAVVQEVTWRSFFTRYVPYHLH